MRNTTMKLKRILMTAVLTATTLVPALACSRVVYKSDSGTVLVGRTLDWRTPIPTNIYVYPAGIQKESMPDGDRLTWTSQYGSVLAVSYDGGVTEGMNDRGLVMNGLFCKGTVYPTPETLPDKPVMSMAVLISYFLDNFATVQEVVDWFDTNEFSFASKTFDGGTASLLHWGITDATGNTAILEYQGGKLNIYTSPDYVVLTNDPPYTQMQAINDYWLKVDGVNMLPGTVRSSDRYVRAWFFVHHVPTNLDNDAAWAAVNSIMGTVSVPYGYMIEGEPNVSMTQWRSISDAKDHIYYFKFADNKSDFWIDLNHLLLTPGSPILKLDTTNNTELSGCVNNKLQVTQGFTPMW